MKHADTTALFSFMKAPVPAGKQTSANNILSARRYVSPRGHRLSPEEAEARQIAYDLKIPTAEACHAAARELAPLVEADLPADTALVLMPVPTSTGSTAPNQRFAEALAAALRRRNPARTVRIQCTVTRKHPVESSCTRRLRGGRGLPADQHAIIKVPGTRLDPRAAHYFIDNMATTGTTLFACRAALGHGNAIVYADKHRP